jgi:hypothetical protein
VAEGASGGLAGSTCASIEPNPTAADSSGIIASAFIHQKCIGKGVATRALTKKRLTAW